MPPSNLALSCWSQGFHLCLSLFFLVRLCVLFLLLCPRVPWSLLSIPGQCSTSYHMFTYGNFIFYNFSFFLPVFMLYFKPIGIWGVLTIVLWIFLPIPPSLCLFSDQLPFGCRFHFLVALSLSSLGFETQGFHVFEGWVCDIFLKSMQLHFHR